MNKKLFILLFSSIGFINMFSASKEPLGTGFLSVTHAEGLGSKSSVAATPVERIKILRRIISSRTSPKRRFQLAKAIEAEIIRLKSINCMEKAYNLGFYNRHFRIVALKDKELGIFYRTRKFAAELQKNK